MKISIIVPVYNVEQYLKKCINSILNQSYKNIELILVNDGSTDNSGKICDEYAEKDNRIKIIHKKNGGLSDARNVGIENSTGTYLSFIDSDDYVEIDMIECLYKACIKNDCDIAWCNMIRENNDGKQSVEVISNQECLFSKEDAYKNILLYNPSVCTKLFKTSLFDNIQFPTGKLYEDIITMNLLINNSKSIVHIGSAKYHYIQRNDSISHNLFNLKKLDYINNSEILSKYILQKYPNLQEVVDAYLNLTVVTVICDMYLSKKIYKQKYNELVKSIRVNKFNLYKNNYISLKKKIMIFLISYKLTGLVIQFKKIKDYIKYK